MPKGKVSFYNQRKGFGFIVDEESQCDIYVHITGLHDNIHDDDFVSYDIIEDERGKKAINVKKVLSVAV